MRIAEARAAPSRRIPVPSAHQQTSQPVTFLGPSNGLVTNTNLAVDQAASALVLDNWIPTERGARVREGNTKYAFIGDADIGEPQGLLLALTKATALDQDVVQLFNYRFGANNKFFAATSTAIYDISNPTTITSPGQGGPQGLLLSLTSPTDAGADVFTPSVSSLGGGDWVTMQQTTPGGSFLVAANGVDLVRNFDGTAWSTPSITAVTSSNLHFCFLAHNRGFFLEKDTMDAWYLPVDNIAGAATVLPLGGVMRGGGSLLAGFTWSMDAGDGLSAMTCFLSTEGEVAVYQGPDPDSANTWALVGVYSLGKPLGKHAIMEAGGDILIATTHGLVPMSQIFNKDQAALKSVAVSKPFEDIWFDEASTRGTNWQIKSWPDSGLAFVSFNEVDGLDNRIFVVNTLTGRWATISGWNARCWGVHNGKMYFGSGGGGIFSADDGATDNGETYLASYLGTFQSVGNHGTKKSAKLMTAELLTGAALDVKLFVNSDYNETLPSAPALSLGTTSSSVWDVGLWDDAVWDAGTTRTRQIIKQSVAASGHTIAGGMLITVGGNVPVNAELLLTKIQVEPGSPEI